MSLTCGTSPKELSGSSSSHVLESINWAPNLHDLWLCSQRFCGGIECRYDCLISRFLDEVLTGGDEYELFTTYTRLIIVFAIPDLNHPDHPGVMSAFEGVEVLALPLSNGQLPDGHEMDQKLVLMSWVDCPGGMTAGCHFCSFKAGCGFGIAVWTSACNRISKGMNALGARGLPWT
jgi:hypothetical protein